MKLQDSALFRQQCHVNGAWREARSGRTITVANPWSVPLDNTSRIEILRYENVILPSGSWHWAAWRGAWRTIAVSPNA